MNLLCQYKKNMKIFNVDNLKKIFLLVEIKLFVYI